MKCDVGLLGNYCCRNWGGGVTVLATYATVKDLGFSAKMLKYNNHNYDEEEIFNQICEFTEVPINAPAPPDEWNRLFSNFLLCSDWTLYKGGMLPFNVRTFTWVEDDVNKISMAASFGDERGGFNDEDYPIVAACLNRFQFLSIREQFGVDLCKRIGVNHAVVMPDPVFSQDAGFFLKIANAFPHKKYKKYAAVYLLDMEKSQIDLAIKTAEKLGLRPLFLVALENWQHTQMNLEALKGYPYIYINHISKSLSAWIYYLYESNAVITNSFHGSCLGYMFGKNVFVIKRKNQGWGNLSSRLVDLLRIFEVKNRFITCPEDIGKAVKERVDNGKIKAKIKSMRKTIREFLLKSITEGKRRENRIDLLPRVKCVGCMSCVQICPKGAINIATHGESGFLYPLIDSAKCVDCGMCKKACPVLNKTSPAPQNNKVYSGYSLNGEIRAESSSGGFFSELAAALLNKGNAAVFGAAFDTPYKVAHIFVTDTAELARIRCSKYVQSEIRNAYIKAEEFLREGKTVMFCGAPCQVAALYAYMKVKNAPLDKLYLVDFICHGVNSPKAYEAYLKEIEAKTGDKVKSLCFRNKETGWENYSIRIDFNSKPPYIKKNGDDDFMKGFLKHHLYSRPSCAVCPFKGEDRLSDITLADAWAMSFGRDTSQGVSAVVIHSDKGMKLFGDIKDNLYIEEKSMAEITRGHSTLIFPMPMGQNSPYFYKRLNEGIPFSKVIEEIENAKKR